MKNLEKRIPLASDIDSMSKNHHGAWKNYQEVQLQEEVYFIDQRWPLLAETQGIRAKVIESYTNKAPQ